MTITVVDPDRAALKHCVQALRRLVPDAEVLMFLSPREAARYLHDNPLDYLFTETEMPEISGFELMERLRQVQPGAKTVFVTKGPAHALEAMRRKASDYLMKPVKDAELLRTLGRSGESAF